MNEVNTIKRILEKNPKTFEPFIQYIRFPYYKKLLEGTRLDFTFPLTVLVGPNGCNKSSILHALYGCPRQNSTGVYWFSTDVDKIDDKKESQCYIHGYWLEVQGDYVEAIKTRINAKEEPDLWETSRPILRHGMKRMPPIIGGNMEGRTKTRWKAIDKDVIYLDFRAEIGAYDCYFWYGEHQKTVTMNTKQDRIRKQSKYLRKVINGKTDSYFLHEKQKVKKYIELSREACEVVSYILGQPYKTIKIIEHAFYGGRFGKTIILQNDDLEYSEAFAGSGETSVVILVNEIMSAQDKSLILLDEPETSLHPVAQRKLQGFLLKTIISKKHQIVIATHSPALLSGLPPEAIKVLIKDFKTGKIKILSKSFPEEAFKIIGVTEPNKLNIFVEDKLTATIIEVYLEKYKKNLTDFIKVLAIPGGAESIIKNYITVAAHKNANNEIFILDGDKHMNNREAFDHKIRNLIELNYLSSGAIDESKIPISQNNNLEKILKEVSGCHIRFNIDGNSQYGGNTEQKHIMERNLLKYWAKHVFYLPGLQPERLLYDNIEENNRKQIFDTIIDHNSVDWKLYYKDKASLELTKSKVVSEDILFIQRQIISKFPEDCEVFSLIQEIVESYFNNGGE